MARRGAVKSGWYCTHCGAMYSRPGEGIITCQRCGHLGLRGFNRPPRRVACPMDGCDFTGWDDGGVNDDLGRHQRRVHQFDGFGCGSAEVSRDSTGSHPETTGK